MAISRSNMGQEIRLAPASRSALKDKIIEKAKGPSMGAGVPNFKARAIRPGGFKNGGPVAKAVQGKGRVVGAGLADSLRARQVQGRRKTLPVQR